MKSQFPGLVFRGLVTHIDLYYNVDGYAPNMVDYPRAESSFAIVVRLTLFFQNNITTQTPK